MAGFAVNSSRLKQAALGGAAIWLAMVPGEAWASCVISFGTGTVAAPDQDSVVRCTGVQNGLSSASANDGTTLVIDDQAEVNGAPGDAIVYSGTGSQAQIYSGAVVRDLTIRVANAPGKLGAGMVMLFGSRLENDDTANQVEIIGPGAIVDLSEGSTIVTASGLTFGGDQANIRLRGRIETASTFVSPAFTPAYLVRGTAEAERFELAGTMAMRPNSFGEFYVLNAGAGDDTLLVTEAFRIEDLATGTVNPRWFIAGGDGNDLMEFAGGGVGIIDYETRSIETMRFTSGTWLLGGSHSATLLEIGSGVTVRTVDYTRALGDTTATVRFADATSVLEINDQFQSSNVNTLDRLIVGNGNLVFQTGQHELLLDNPDFSGTLTNRAAVKVLNAGAFGGAAVINDGLMDLGGLTIGNRLSGSGTYTISGPGAQFGNALNAISGTIEIQPGADLSAASLGALGNGNATNPAALQIYRDGRLIINIAGNGNLNPTDPNQLLGNSLLADGQLVKRGIGNLVISHANSAFAGSVRLEGGRTLLAVQDALGTSRITLAGGGLVVGDISLGNQLLGAGSVEKTSAGRTAVTADNQAANLTWSVNAGTLAGTRTRNFGAAGSTVSLGGSATFELTNATDQDFDLRVSGLSGSTFRKLGGGRLSFVDQFNVSNLAVDAGSIRVNQTITANATLASATRLDGTGRIIGNLANNGTVAPGNSIGTLTVQGNYVHGANAVLEIEFNGSGGIDLLDVTGNVTLNGGTLRFVSLGSAEGSGGTFLKAGGTLTGTFATVETVGAQLPLAVIYQPNSALMAPSVLTARPSTFNAQFLAAAETGSSFAELNDAAIRRLPRGTQLWLDGFGSDGQRSASGQTLAYEHNTYGLAGGVTFQLGETTSLGLTAGWTRGDIALGANGGGGKQSSVLGALTLRHDFGDAVFTGGALFGKIDQQTLRNIAFNGFAASVNGATESTIYGGFLGLDLPIANLGKWSLRGKLRGTWVHQNQDGYTESGNSPLRLTLGDLSAETLEGQAGMSIGRHFGPQGGGANLRLDVGGRVLGLGGDRLIPVSFAASNAAVTLQGDTRDSLHGYAAAALDIPLSEAARVHIGYSGQFGATDRHLGRIGLSFGF